MPETYDIRAEAAPERSNIRIVMKRIGRGRRGKRMGADLQSKTQRVSPHELIGK